MADQKVLKGLDAALHNGFGWFKRRKWHQSKLQRRAAAIHGQSVHLSSLSPQDMAMRMQTCRELVNRDPLTASAKMDEVISVLVEAAYRSLNKRPYVVQIMGALALHSGCVAEMATGEGKTLTVGLAAVLAGWGGRPTHILTANDYLAERDAAELAPLYTFCGLHVGSCLQEMEAEERQALYRSDLVYVTPKVLLADILRDELKKRSGSHDLTLPRGIHTAIIDEADSMMIDEAITPLIISAPRDVPGLKSAVQWAQSRAAALVENIDYRVDPRHRRVELGILAEDPRLVPDADLPPSWQAQSRRISLIRQALQAKHNFLRGVHYVIEDDKIVLIDEFTGRLTGERSLSGGLHQAIEAKENVPLTQPNMPMIQMSFQQFFKRFKRLACTTGTANEAAVEFWHIYKRAVIAIPTNRPRQVREIPAQVYADRARKFNAIACKAKQLSQAGHPVLVGARALLDSEELAAIMGKMGLKPQVLNAIYHEEEGAIIAEAGEASSITIATNMAGRGVDISLPDGVLEQGGLHVIICEPNDSARVDRQLAGRCGRQGQPGVVHRFFALDDKLFGMQLSWAERAVMRIVLSIMPTVMKKSVRMITKRAQNRFEKNSYLSRKALLENEEWLDQALPFNVVR